MLTRWLYLFVALPLLTVANVAEAAPILDQSDTPSGGLVLNQSLEWQQQVTDGLAGTLAGIELYAEAPTTLTVKIGLGSAFSTGPFAFTGSETIAGPSGTFIDTSAANIALTLGETFVIDLSGGYYNGQLNGAYLMGSTNTYTGGDLFVNDNGIPVDDTTLANFGYSLAFETFITPSSTQPVPEPGSLSLFVPALLGLAFFYRRKRFFAPRS